MNRYESVLLDKMVEIQRQRGEGEDIDDKAAHWFAITSLLECIVGFREPPRGLAVEEGCGKLVASDE